MITKISKLIVQYKNSPIFVILIINLGIVALWGASVGLQKIAIPFFVPVFGTLALLAPGICLTLMIEQIAETKNEFLVNVLWVGLFSCLITPAGVFAISEILLKQPPVTDVVTPFLIWWGISLVMLIIVSLIKYRPISLKDYFIDAKTSMELKYIILAYVAILTVNFIVYPLVPEGDVYAYLVNWHNIMIDPRLLAGESRSLFLVFVNVSSQLLKLDPYWIAKVFIPLSHITIILAVYIFLRNFITDSRYRILLSLSPLFFPVVLEEILIGRPQSIFLISFLPSVVILSEILSDKKNLRQVYWLIALAVVGVVGLKIHTLFALIPAIAFISILLFLKEEFTKRPFDWFIIGLGLFVLLYPQFPKARVLTDSLHVVGLFIESFRRGQFDLWFIDHYRNVDGAEVGWPGFLSIFYYGYNLGLVFPILFILLIARKKMATFKSLAVEKYWAIIFLFSFFFFIAEIGPRFKIAYLPDRAWLFLALIFSLLLPLIIVGLRKNSNPRFIVFVTIISFLSIAAGTGLTYAKQGWVTPNEVKAGKFITANTPQNAIFLTQGGTRMMVRYYTNRFAIRPDDPAIFLTGEKSELESYLRIQEGIYQEAQATYPGQIKSFDDRLNGLYREKGYLKLTDVEREELLASLLLIHQRKDSHVSDMARLKELYPTIGRPVYLMYNKNKFGSLYGGRSWWRSSNFYGANVEKLSKNYPIIYNQDGILIWEVRK
jgi:hypothetical protein